MKIEQLVLRAQVVSQKGAALKVMSFDLSASGVKALASRSSKELPAARLSQPAFAPPGPFKGPSSARISIPSSSGKD